MNTMLKTLQFRTETTETLCPTHHIPLMEIAGHKLCKLCAKETVHHSHAAFFTCSKGFTAMRSISNRDDGCFTNI